MDFSPVILKSRASAKLNTALKIVGKRPDNYHLLDSVFVPVPQLFDEISITLSAGKNSVIMSSNLEEMTDAETNLCSKAAKKYFEMTDISVKCHIELIKNIPIGAGLGGGSSDAAEVLKMLNSHYKKLSAQEMHSCALSLGADVPFFLVNKPSRVSGIGENIMPFECRTQLHLMIISPPFAISTPWAFKHLDPSIIGQDPSNLSSKLVNALENDDILTAAECMHNDFEKLLFNKFPAYIIWRDYLRQHGALHVGISGSGSSFFALFESASTLAAAKKEFYGKFGTVIKSN